MANEINFYSNNDPPMFIVGFTCESPIMLASYISYITDDRIPIRKFFVAAASPLHQVGGDSHSASYGRVTHGDRTAYYAAQNLWSLVWGRSIEPQGPLFEGDFEEQAWNMVYGDWGNMVSIPVLWHSKYREEPYETSFQIKVV